MNQATKEFRENLAKRFIQSLSEDKVKWQKNWIGLGKGGRPVNAVTGRSYSGLNRFVLMWEARVRDSDDSRWATFQQIKKAGWQLNKGAKGVKVEYWQPYDFTAKQPITWPEYYQQHDMEGIGVISKYFYVFNAKDITGIPERAYSENKEVVSDQLITKIAKGMEISIFNDGGDRAYYRIATDDIHLPTPESFKSSYDYNATALHELSHATGATHRLARDMNGIFGSEQYAYEELVAEISSSFMSEHLDYQPADEHFENHKAYIQSWITRIGKDPNILVKAIKEADAAANYIEYHGGIITREEYESSLGKSLEINESAVNQKEEMKKPLEQHGEIRYGTLNLGSTGLNADNVPVAYDSMREAINAYLEADVDGKSIGVFLKGEYKELANFDMVAYQNKYSSNAYHLSEAYAVNEVNKIQNDIRRIRYELDKDNVSKTLQSNFADLARIAGEQMEKQNSEWGSWFGRVANDSRPQDYIVMDITGNSTRNEVIYKVHVVHANEVVDSKCSIIKTDTENFKDSIRRGTEQACKEFSGYLNDDVVVKLGTDCDRPFSVYSPVIGRPMEEHYKKLNNIGYEEEPSFKNYQPSENEDIWKDRNLYKFFYAGEQDKEAEVFREKKGWNKLLAPESLGLNGDTWVVYRSVEDLPLFLQAYIKVHESTEIEIKKRIHACGYKATNEIVDMYKALEKELGRRMQLQEICAAYKDDTYSDMPKVDSLLKNIAEQFKGQETLMLQMETLVPEL